MYINSTKSDIVLGRFTIKPGESFSGMGLSEREKTGLSGLVSKGLLKEWTGVAKQAVKAAEPLTTPTLATDYTEVVATEAASTAEAETTETSTSSKKSSKKK